MTADLYRTHLQLTKAIKLQTGHILSIYIKSIGL